MEKSKNVIETARAITVAAVSNPGFFVSQALNEDKISLVTELYKNILKAVNDTIEM